MKCPCCGYGGELEVTMDIATIVGKDWHEELSPVQATIAKALLKARPRVVTIDQMITKIYNLDEPVDVVNVLRVQINRLRHLVGPHGVVIKNAWGKGYRIL